MHAVLRAVVLLVGCALLAAACSDPLDVEANRRKIGDTTSHTEGGWPVVVQVDTLNQGCIWPGQILTGRVVIRDTSATDSARIERLVFEPAGVGFSTSHAVPFVVPPRDSVVLVISFQNPAAGNKPIPPMALSIYGDSTLARDSTRFARVGIHAVGTPYDTTITADSVDFFTIDSTMATPGDSTFVALRNGKLITHNCFPITIAIVTVSGPDADVFDLVSMDAPLPASVPENSKFAFTVSMTTRRRGTLHATVRFGITTLIGQREVWVELVGRVL